MPDRPFPLAPLAAVLGVDLHVVGGHQEGDDPTGLALLADLLGISHRHARRLEQRGLDDRQADHFATRAGLHPSSVWGSAWWALTPMAVSFEPAGVA